MYFVTFYHSISFNAHSLQYGRKPMTFVCAVNGQCSPAVQCTGNEGGFHGWKKVSVKLRMVKRQLQKEFGIQKKKEKSLGRHFATFNWQIEFPSWRWCFSCLVSNRLVLDQQRPLPDRRSYMLTVRHALTRKLTRSKTMQWWPQQISNSSVLQWDIQEGCVLSALKTLQFYFGLIQIPWRLKHKETSESFIPQRFKLQVWQSSPHLLYLWTTFRVFMQQRWFCCFLS